MPEELSTLQQRLKQAQSDVQKIGQRREALSREAGIEEHKVKESVARLRELGIQDAAVLTVDQLEALLRKTQKDLEANLSEVSTKITEANQVLTEYEATVQG